MTAELGLQEDGMDPSARRPGPALPRIVGGGSPGFGPLDPGSVDPDDQTVRNRADAASRWRSGGPRLLYPAVWLIFLVQTVGAVAKDSHGLAAVAGYLIVVAYCAVYIWSITSLWSGDRRQFWTGYLAMIALMAAETLFAHQDAFVMATFVAVMTVGGLGRLGFPVIGVLTAVAVLVPRFVPSWHAGYDTDMLLTIPLVSFAIWSMFQILRGNAALAAARSEVARLAAENERSRIARDLHDLLGHSLTTITVKAGLAARLVDRDPARAAEEITEVEALTRRSLADVRAAVAGYRDVTLVGELATSREVLRAAGVDPQFPGAIDVVHPELAELFGWVVREGVTNVVRHSHASVCRITAGPTWLQIEDDGRGGTVGAGNGLTGLRERVDAAGGTVDVRSGGVLGASGGWRVRVDVPALVTVDAR